MHCGDSRVRANRVPLAGVWLTGDEPARRAFPAGARHRRPDLIEVILEAQSSHPFPMRQPRNTTRFPYFTRNEPSSHTRTRRPRTLVRANITDDIPPPDPDSAYNAPFAASDPWPPGDMTRAAADKKTDRFKGGVPSLGGELSGGVHNKF